MKRRTIVYVTGTRADFGLMKRTLAAVRAHPGLRLRVVATGMHLQKSRGDTLRELRAAGFAPEVVIPWKDDGSPASVARATHLLGVKLVEAYAKLKAEGVLVLGDRVEAFAAASAAHLSGLLVGHVHGGDRALGQADDSLRHAISKLAHVHFAATADSGRRLAKLGEEKRRIFVVGAPGIEAITADAWSKAEVREFFGDVSRTAVVALHPVSADAELEERQTTGVIKGVLAGGVEQLIAVMPNTDPGADGIMEALYKNASERVLLLRHVERDAFLGLLRDAAVLVGNSSAGIIEAASFGMPVVDVGPRQTGRLCGRNVVHVGYGAQGIAAEVRRVVEGGVRYRAANPYARAGTAGRIAAVLAGAGVWKWPRNKVIAY